jgi:15-cis-phytoene synthase
MPVSLPDSAERADLAACRALLRHGSKSFHAASLLLPARVRAPASALYAFCRVADDAIDDGGSAAALDRLQRRLDDAYAGRPHDNPVDRAFAATARRFMLPKALPEALLDGFAWDLNGRVYGTQADLEGYCVRVAGTVGVMMAVLMGRRGAEALARAADLGIAMQLTNIARDVGEDARNGRLYLPSEWLAAEGMDPMAFLAKPEMSDGFRAVMKRLLALAEFYYARSKGGIAMLPLDCRPAIHAARLIYGEIGRNVTAAGYDSISRRAVTSRGRKLELLAQAVGATAIGSIGHEADAAEAARYLVDAAAEVPKPEGLVGVIALFDRLERRDREARVARGTGLARG